MAVTRTDRTTLHRWVLQYQDGEEEGAAERVLRAVEPLLRSRVGRCRRPVGEQEDLMQVARLCTLGAMRRWSPEGGAAFTTFLTRTVDGGLKRHFRDTGWDLHVPRGAKNLALQVTDARRRLARQGEGAPTVAELAIEAGISEAEVRTAREAGMAYRSDSLDKPVGEGGDDLLMLLPDPAEPPDRDVLLAVMSCARTLPARQRLVLYLTYYGGLSQREIAARIGCSQMHVSRLLRRSLARLREELADTPPVLPAAA